MYFHKVVKFPYTLDNSDIVNDGIDHSIIYHFSKKQNLYLRGSKRLSKDAYIISMDDKLPESIISEWANGILIKVKPVEECFLGVCTHVNHNLSHGVIRSLDTKHAYNFQEEDLFSVREFQRLSRGHFVILKKVSESKIQIIFRIVNGLSIYCNPNQLHRRENLMKLFRLANVEFDKSIFDIPLHVVLKPTVVGKGDKNCSLSYSLKVKN